MRTVELPLMTPTRSREDECRRPSLGGIQEYVSTGQGVLLQFEQSQFEQAQAGQGRLSGSTTVEEPGEMDTSVEEGKSREVDEIDEVDLGLETEEDVKEAKTNRKVCLSLATSTRCQNVKVLMLQIADLEITNASLLAINRSLEGDYSVSAFRY